MMQTIHLNIDDQDVFGQVIDNQLEIVNPFRN